MPVPEEYIFEIPSLLAIGLNGVGPSFGLKCEEMLTRGSTRRFVRASDKKWCNYKYSASNESWPECKYRGLGDNGRRDEDEKDTAQILHRGRLSGHEN